MAQKAGAGGAEGQRRVTEAGAGGAKGQRRVTEVDARGCLVCTARGRSQKPSPYRTSRVTVQAKSLLLCREHAGLVAIQMPKTWEELRAVFAARIDRRSPIPRRVDNDDRRVFPPRPEGRRRSFGRRKSDSDES